MNLLRSDGEKPLSIGYGDGSESAVSLYKLKRAKKMSH